MADSDQFLEHFLPGDSNAVVKLRGTIAWRPKYDLAAIVRDVIESRRTGEQ